MLEVCFPMSVVEGIDEGPLYITWDIMDIACYECFGQDHRPDHASFRH